MREKAIRWEREQELRAQARTGLDMSPPDPALVDALAILDNVRRQAQKMIFEMNGKVQYLVDYVHTHGKLPLTEKGFTFPDGETWYPSGNPPRLHGESS